jgi:hypothetical protein
MYGRHCGVSFTQFDDGSSSARTDNYHVGVYAGGIPHCLIDPMEA